jgi:hypothetical protein
LQDRGSVKEYSDVVGPLVVVDLGAVEKFVRSVKNIVDVIDQADASSPVPDLVGPVQVGIVASVASESSRDLEEATVGN